MNSSEARRCLEKAVEFERRAEQATDDVSRKSYRRLAGNWRLLANSYKRIAEMDEALARKKAI